MTQFKIGDAWFKPYLLKWFEISSALVIATMAVVTTLAGIRYFPYAVALLVYLTLPLVLTFRDKPKLATYLYFGGLATTLLVVVYLERVAAVLDVFMLVYVAAAIIGNAALLHVLFGASVTTTLLFVGFGRLTLEFGFGTGNLPSAATALFSLPMMFMGYIIALAVDKILIRTIHEQETRITLLNQLQDELVLKEKLASVGELAGGVAHEINNPLMGIINYLDLVLDEDHGDPTIRANSETHEFLTETRADALRISRITRDLLAFARNEDASAPRLVDLREVLDRTTGLLHHQLTRDGIQLERAYRDYTGDVLVRVPVGEIQQLILAILQNARTSLNTKWPPGEPGTPATPRPEKHIRITITGPRPSPGADPDAQDESRPALLRVTFWDNGIGMEKSLVKRLFEPFFTSKRLLNGMTREIFQGSGLSLATVQKRVVALGGEIKVDTKPGEYFQICVDLPGAPGAVAS